MKKLLCLLLALCMVFALVACGSSDEEETAESIDDAVVEEEEEEAEPEEEEEAEPEPEEAEEPEEEAEPEDDFLAETTIYIDIAASLEAVFVDVIIPAYAEVQPNVTVEYNTGSSGKLLTGIEEANGIGHDIFFSAGKSQVTTLNETDGLVVDGSIVNLLSNQVCLVKGVDTETAVTGWDTLNLANTMALCDGSVPVGKYTRIALVSLGVLEDGLYDDPADFTTQEISDALGGVEIDEADDVEVAAAKAVEQSVEVATIYYSDYYNHQDDLTIIAQDDGTLTGDIIYPVCQVVNAEADDAELAAAEDFLAFLQTDVCLEAYAEYCFIVNG